MTIVNESDITAKIGNKTKGVRGPAAKPSDFEPNLDIVDDE